MSTAIEGKNWWPPVSETVATAPLAHQYVRPTPVSYEHHTTFGCPLTMAIAGNELSRNRYPGSGLGRSVKAGGLISIGVVHPRCLPRQCASQIDPWVDVKVGNSS